MNGQPIITALANPEPEIAEDLALEAGAAIVAQDAQTIPTKSTMSWLPWDFPRCFGCEGQRY